MAERKFALRTRPCVCLHDTGQECMMPVPGQIRGNGLADR